MKDRLKAAIDRYDHLTQQLSDPEISQDGKKIQELSRERSSLDRLVGLAREYLSALEEKEQAEELLSSGGDMAELAQEEVQSLSKKIPELEDQIKFELLPKDPNEGKNVILEIRAGAGGEEAALFAMDLFRLYCRYADEHSWKVQLLSESFAGQGGYKEVVAAIEGSDCWRWLKYESGVHRVQRIPSTEASGRIHTSTVTVAIMAEAEETDLDINSNDLRIDVFRAGGKGGQGVNTTDSAVRITHLPTNTVVVCQDERSQIKNKAKAMKVLRSRLLQSMQDEEAKSRAADRKSQVGTGDRSERIRTYNFPQERVTDHRIGLTLKKLSSIMEGHLDEVVLALQTEENAEKLAQASL